MSAERVNHLNLVVADIERSLAFYVGQLGMRVTFEKDLEGEWFETVVGLPGARARCVFVQPEKGGCRLELLEYLVPRGRGYDDNSAPHTLGLRHFALDVDDLDGTYERLAAAGVVFVSPPVTVPFRIVEGIQKRLCYAQDPDGVIVELCEHRTELG